MLTQVLFLLQATDVKPSLTDMHIMFPFLLRSNTAAHRVGPAGLTCDIF